MHARWLLLLCVFCVLASSAAVAAASGSYDSQQPSVLVVDLAISGVCLIRLEIS